MPKIIDVSGMKFGRLTALKRNGIKGNNSTWLCICECGNETTVILSSLRQGNTRSCGCYAKEVQCQNLVSLPRTHGLSKTRIYNIYYGLLNRCLNPKDPAFRHYGKRGISVCEEWKDSFENFYIWAVSNGYDDYLSIERVNNDGHYGPDNCKWVTQQDQLMNRRTTINVTINGITRTLKEWSKISGINYGTLRSRYKDYGWHPDRLLDRVQEKRRG